MSEKLSPIRSKEYEAEPSNIAFLWPGQGAQIQGMGRSLYEGSEASRKIFTDADKLLGFSISELCFSGRAEDLEKTEIAQPAIGTVCLAAHAAVKELAEKHGVSLTPTVGAGISFGELPNLVASGVIDQKTFYTIIQSRSTIMEEVGTVPPGEMKSVLGITDRSLIEQICIENKVYPAIYYPGITVISGLYPFIDNAAFAFEQHKARVRPTGVKYPFHTPHMKQAEERFLEFLQQFEFRDPEYPVVLNATGESTTSGREIRKRLPEQLTRTVDGVKVINAFSSHGAHVVVEFCPRPVLGSLVTKVDSTLQSFSIHSMDSLNAFFASRT